ncbi:MAG: Uma2 family endonuclease [Spirosomaceae bacterium]|jgi:Uma2 family endonuclease|nr:Uma2 family endonuclease [Spirosomataceae bacterium]
MASIYYPRTFEGFMNWKPETRYKYEWNRGKIEKTENMKQLEFLILKALNRLFVQTKAFQNGDELITEGDVMTSEEQLRRPDLAYYTKNQIIESARGNNQMPSFVIEIISPSDNQTKILEKNKEYFQAGVKVIWLIMPSIKQVHIFHSPKQIQICTDDDICSAAPIIPDFAITVNDLLRLPV